MQTPDVTTDSDTGPCGRSNGSEPGKVSVYLIPVAASGILSVACGFFVFGPELAGVIARKSTYWFLFIAFALFLFSIWRCLGNLNFRVGVRAFLRPRLLVFVAAVSLLFLVMQPSSYKVVMDEPVVVGTSYQMHAARELSVPDTAYTIGGVFYVIESYVDKRPGFFPFLLSLLHDFTGYRSNQGFILNALLVPVFVLLLAWTGHQFWPNAGGYAAALLALTVPLFADCMNGSLFDLLNVVMILATFALSVHYLRCPGPERLNLLLLCAVLLAHTRYESALYVLPVAGVVFFGWWRAGKIVLSATAALIPLFFIPLALLLGSFKESPDQWQMRGEDAQAFSVGFLRENLESAARFFFQFGNEQPNSLILSVLFVVALAAALVLVLFRRRPASAFGREAAVVFPSLAIGGGVLFGMVLILCYHWGQLDDYAATRLAMPFIVLQILTVVVVAGRCLRSNAWAVAFFGVCIIYFVADTRKTCAAQDFSALNPAAKLAHWTQGKIREHKDEGALFITQQRMLAFNEGFSGTTLIEALAHKSRLHLHQTVKTFNHIYFIYLLENQGDLRLSPFPSDLIESNFDLTVLDTFAIDPFRRAAFARLDQVKFGEGEKPSVDMSLFEGVEDPSEWLNLIPSTLP